MSDRIAALVAAAITLPLALLLIWWGLRNLIARVRDVRVAVENEMGEGPGPLGEAGATSLRRRDRLSYEPDALAQQPAPNTTVSKHVGSNLHTEATASQISETVWVSDAQADSELILFATTDIATNEVDRAIEAETLLQKGASVPAEMCPKRVWGNDPEHPLKRVPHLLNVRGFYIVSAKAADVLRQFDLGGGALHPVTGGVFQNDQTTRIPGEYFSWVFGNQKQAVSSPDSKNLRAFAPGYDGWWKMPFVINDNDIAVTTAAIGGADVWLDPTLFKSIFLSGRLGGALVDAGLGKAFRLKKCRVVEGT